MNDQYIKAEGLQAQRRDLEGQRNESAAAAYLEEIKGDSDYAAAYVKQLTKAIEDEEAKKKNASGADADITIAEANLVIDWYNEELTEKKEKAKSTLAAFEEA